MSHGLPMTLRFVLLLFLSLSAFPGNVLAQPAGDGIYARFDTSKGVFFCRLEHALVPRTVANFVGLAEGTKRFIDYPLNKITNRPFFDNLLFHRVVANFVIQGGSPNGSGTDNPGYRFKDEFHPALSHHQAGVLSMANSGTNSNGSQFFITLAPASHLDNKHSVFGQVVEGMDIVFQIGSVPVDANSKPIVPVVMHSVTILRVGSDANAFNAPAIQPPLPEPRGIRSEMRGVGTSRLLLWPASSNHDYRLVASTDLVRWSFVGIANGGAVALNPALPRLFLTVYETNVDQ
jgi:cyclophilin family peptidyl-prolyl cis-trans isomerase